MDSVVLDLASSFIVNQESIRNMSQELEQELQVNTLQECGYYDVEQLHKATRLFLQTLVAASVEKTIGDPFNQPVSVLGEIKMELVEYLEHQSLQYAAAFTTLAGDHVQQPKPLKVLQGFLDGFVRSKANLLARVSSRILNNDKKDEKIEELVAELDRNGAWMIGRREALAKTLIRRIDRSMIAHCEMRFGSSEELVQHKASCSLRPMTCTNEGCTDVYSAVQVDEHDSTCAYKMLTCEQGCRTAVRRGDMDKHCVSICPMRMVTCPFQAVGCVDKLPQGTVDIHCAGNVSGHLLSVLHVLQRLEISLANQSQRVSVLEKAVEKGKEHGNPN